MAQNEARKSVLLEDRKAAILRAVVAQYIETAQPVGSKRIAGVPEVAVSPATVRNELLQLEQLGYLHQPHTSAGRVPTDQGYRFFVDSLDEPGRLQASDTRTVREFFDDSHTELEQLLSRTSSLLSRLTGSAGVVVGSAHDVAVVRSVQLVDLAPHHLLAVAVLANGSVEKWTVDAGDEVGVIALDQATTALAAAMVGRPFGSSAPLSPSGDEFVDQMASAVHHAIEPSSGAEADSVFVGGTAQVAAAFDAISTVREVLAVLEQQFVVVTIVKDVLDRGMSVAIGSETGVEPLADCSIVLAPYEVDGEPAGSIGVLGPTRMNYPQALAAVAVVSQRLGRRITEG